MTNAQAALLAAAAYCDHPDMAGCDVPAMAAEWADTLDRLDRERTRLAGSLVGWLLGQTDREDEVGRLARQVAGDRQEGLLPRFVSRAPALREYLLTQEFEADGEMFRALNLAAREHEVTR